MNRLYEDWDSWFMAHAYLASYKSFDPRTKIGAILVRDKNIISTGFNGFPRGVNDLEERYNNRENKLNMICHAEFNSIISAARNGISTLNSHLYTQGIICSSCCKALIQAGISVLVTHSVWPNLTYSEEWVKSIELSKLMLNEAGIVLKTVDKKLGLKGYLDGKEIDI